MKSVYFTRFGLTKLSLYLIPLEWSALSAFYCTEECCLGFPLSEEGWLRFIKANPLIFISIALKYFRFPFEKRTLLIYLFLWSTSLISCFQKTLRCLFTYTMISRHPLAKINTYSPSFQVLEPSLWWGRPCPEATQWRACWGSCSSAWVPGGWSECLVEDEKDCGAGKQTRSVR